MSDVGQSKKRKLVPSATGIHGIKDANKDEVGRPKIPTFKPSTHHRQKHSKPIYGLDWSTDLFSNQQGDTFLHFATAARYYVTVYRVRLGRSGRSFPVVQRWKDEDKTEDFYVCTFAGRSKSFANIKLRKGITVVKSASPNNEDDEPNYDARDSSSEEEEEHQTVIIDKNSCIDANYLQSNNVRGPQLLCVAGTGKIIKVIDLVEKLEVIELQGHGHDIYDLKRSPTDEDLLLSASVDETVRLWNLQSFACVAIFGGQHGHEREVLSLAWNPSGDQFASSGSDTSIRLWSTKTRLVQEAISASRGGNRQNFSTVTQHFPLFLTKKLHRNVVDCIHFLGTDLILSKSSYNSIIIWKPDFDDTIFSETATTAFEPPSEVIVFHTFNLDDCNLWFHKFVIHPRHSHFAIGTTEGEVHIWDIDGQGEQPVQRIKYPKESGKSQGRKHSFPRNNKTIRNLAFEPTKGEILIGVLDSGYVIRYDSVR